MWEQVWNPSDGTRRGSDYPAPGDRLAPRVCGSAAPSRFTTPPRRGDRTAPRPKPPPPPSLQLAAPASSTPLGAHSPPGVRLTPAAPGSEETTGLHKTPSPAAPGLRPAPPEQVPPQLGRGQRGRPGGLEVREGGQGKGGRDAGSRLLSPLPPPPPPRLQQPGPTPSPTHPPPPCSQPRGWCGSPSPPPRQTLNPTHAHSPPAAPLSLTLPSHSLTCLACARLRARPRSHTARATPAGAAPRSLRPKRRAPPARPRAEDPRAHPAPPSRRCCGAAAGRGAVAGERGAEPASQPVEPDRADLTPASGPAPQAPRPHSQPLRPLGSRRGGGRAHPEGYGSSRALRGRAFPTRPQTVLTEKGKPVEGRGLFPTRNRVVNPFRCTYPPLPHSPSSGPT
ncbi:basic proline-rich protein-like [Bos taurus]|uniref:basic proline-rich protein-like n=1 Tax=Bos taurus TaxID=9913 RepID=UPI0028CBAC65|nr:basic proline-rich protein-like [Bos taurus]